MALIDNYLLTPKNLNPFLEAISNAQAPPKFTNTFLKQLEFTSSNDLLLIRLLKGLGFLDSAGVPTQRYFRFLDKTESAKVLAEAIKEAYSDLFQINTKANEMTVDEIKNKFKTITQGKKSDNVISLMANTFKKLCEGADFNSESSTKNIIQINQEIPKYQENNNQQQSKALHEINKNITTEMHYNIQIHLPETREIAVYDAIFKSLKEHLL